MSISFLLQFRICWTKRYKCLMHPVTGECIRAPKIIRNMFPNIGL